MILSLLLPVAKEPPAPEDADGSAPPRGKKRVKVDGGSAPPRKKKPGKSKHAALESEETGAKEEETGAKQEAKQEAKEEG